MAGIAPGLDGYIAAQQLGQQRQQAETGALMQLLQVQNQMEQAAQAREMRPLQMEALRSQIATRNAAEQQAQRQQAAQGALSSLLATGGYQGALAAPTAVASNDAEALRMVQEAEAQGRPMGVNVPNPQNVKALTSMAFPTQFGTAQANALFREPKLAPAPAPFTLKPGDQRYDADGKLIISVPDRPRGGDSTPKAPTGYRFTDAGTLEPIPGGPADAKVGAQAEKDNARIQGALSRADLILGNVDKAVTQTTGANTGLSGALLGAIPGTGAFNYQKTLDTIKANIGFQELQAMREASPTGGALGQVAVKEIEFLQAVLGSIDRGQDQAQQKAALVGIGNHYENWRNAVRQSKGLPPLPKKFIVEPQTGGASGEWRVVR